MNNQEIINRLQAIEGTVGFYYKNLVTGETLEYGTEQQFVAASVIKLPLMVVVEQYFAAGKLDPHHTVTITEGEKVGGCGGLSLIPEDVVISIRGLCNNMIALSDNTATNKLLSIVSLEAAKREFAALNLEQTRINRKLFDSAAKEKGLENYFVLREIMELLEGLYHGRVGGPQVSRAVLDTLKRQQINHKIPCRIGDGTVIAHKTGEDAGISHDVAVVYAKTPYLLGFASNDVDVYTMEDAIKTISHQLHCRNR